MTLLKEGRNCWRITRAKRVAFLIDGKAYFEVLAEAVANARRRVFIAGWDIDSRIRLRRKEGSGSGGKRLGAFLNARAEAEDGLQIYILSWDFPMLYVRERELLPIFNLGWKTHRRVHFHPDDEHPIGASQHQKFVVIDDRTAFCGGLDLTNRRWDTSRHRTDDPRREDPYGESYGPFHDVQMMVDGEAAAALGELFLDRWRWATGERIETGSAENGDPWPGRVTPDLEDAAVAVARTLPAYKDRGEVREIETLYRDGIAAAETSIYIENQYLTSAKIVQSLEARLKRNEGPEIVIVLPERSSGWLEQSTMDALRERCLARLSGNDRHGRLRVYFPAPDNGGEAVYVHSKLMIVDDRLAVVGSANLSNRSMGFDSECCLAVEGAGDNKTAGAISALRCRLLADHLGLPEEEVSDAFREDGSMSAVIESLSGSNGRGLNPLDLKKRAPVDAVDVLNDRELLDPEEPIEFDRMMDRFVQGENGKATVRQVVKIGGVLLVLLALAAAWQWTPLADWLDRETLAAWARAVRDNPAVFPIVLGAYVAGGLAMVPVTLLIGVTAIVFSPPWGAVYALSGCLSNALATYLIGWWLGRKPVRKLAGERLNRLSRQMAKKGILAVAVMRNIPVAHFGIVNMIAGASHIRLRDFMIGTALGMLPGILAITLFADRLVAAFKDPGWINAAIVAALAMALLLGSWWAKKRLSGNSAGK